MSAGYGQGCRRRTRFAVGAHARSAASVGCGTVRGRARSSASQSGSRWAGRCRLPSVDWGDLRSDPSRTLARAFSGLVFRPALWEGSVSLRALCRCSNSVFSCSYRAVGICCQAIGSALGRAPRAAALGFLPGCSCARPRSRRGERSSKASTTSQPRTRGTTPSRTNSRTLRCSSTTASATASTSTAPASTRRLRTTWSSIGRQSAASAALRSGQLLRLLRMPQPAISQVLRSARTGARQVVRADGGFVLGLRRAASNRPACVGVIN